ncbi:MAG: riboflavin synthase [Ignavibacteriales bacterium]|nr:MAG: riboflavin synthase [Ignavibacteriales bacterium]
MFTGLVEETGVISRIQNAGLGRRITIAASVVTSDIQTGDSINVSGACQTVIHAAPGEFTVEAVEETLKKTTFGLLKQGDRVNLERSLLPTTRLGGHFVSGHVDTRGQITSLQQLSNSWLVTVQYPAEFSKYIIPVGSIAIDGISLTVAEKGDDWFRVAIIPHTWGVTTMKDRKTGDRVNLEFDLLGKYILNAAGIKEKPAITEEWLKEQGW